MDDGNHVEFFADAVKDENASQKAGRPVYRDVHKLRVRLRFDPRNKPVFLADAYTTRRGQDGQMEHIRYRDLYSRQYEAFLQGVEYTGGGTPIAELTTLTEAKRRELRDMGIYTVEHLAELDGAGRKKLGVAGNRLIGDAQSYLETAAGLADRREKDELQRQIEDLQARMAEMAQMAQAPAPQAVEPVEDDPFPELSNEEMFTSIEQLTGTKPHHKTGRKKLGELLQAAVAKANNTQSTVLAAE